MYFLPSSHNREGKAAWVIFTELFHCSVNNYHSADHRKKVHNEVVEGSWSNLVTRCSFPLPTHCHRVAALSGLAVLSHGTTGAGFPLQLLPLSLLSACAGLAACLSHAPVLPKLFFRLCALCGVSSVLPVLQQWGFKVPAGEHSRLSHKQFPFQYRWRSRGGKSLPQHPRFPLVTYWSQAGKAQPVRGPWLVGAGRARQPQSLPQPRVGISQPIPLPVLSTGGWGTDCHTGWELVAVRALPTAGKDSQAETGFFTAKRHGRGREPFPGERKALFFCHWSRPSSASLSRNTITAPLFQRNG